NVTAVGLVVPGMGPAVRLDGLLGLGAQQGVAFLGLGQIGGLPGGAVQPDRASYQLVVEPAPGIVKGRDTRNGVGILAPVFVREVVELPCMGKKLGGIGGVGSLEHHGDGGEGG